MTKGKFISIEGGEGGGKSTQSRLIVAAFEDSKIDIVQTREPGGTKGAESIRALLVTGEVNKWDAKTETLLHLAARSDHISKLISPAISGGKYVICDRFIDSTMAYQGFGHGLGEKFVNDLQQLIIADFKPDLTIILDVDVDMGINRASSRGGDENRYEKMGSDFHQKVLSGFRSIAEKNKDRCILISADDTINNIHRKIIDTVNGKFGLSLKYQTD